MKEAFIIFRALHCAESASPAPLYFLKGKQSQFVLYLSYTILSCLCLTLSMPHMSRDCFAVMNASQALSLCQTLERYRGPDTCCPHGAEWEGGALGDEGQSGFDGFTYHCDA